MSDPIEEREGILWMDNIACVPAVHGRASFAREVRRVFLDRAFDCVAVELPSSLYLPAVEAAQALPHVTAVTYREDDETVVYVPMDPCDAIVEGIRMAIRERCPLEFIDMDVADYQNPDLVLPDDYAVGRIGLAAFYRAVARALPPTPKGSQGDLRERFMAEELRRLKERHRQVLFITGMAHLRGIARAIRGRPQAVENGPPPLSTAIYTVHPDSLYPVLGELPYATYLYERLRESITLDEFEKVDALKETVVAAREAYDKEFPEEVFRLSVQDLQILLRYVRNLCIIEGRLTPGLYELAVAAKGAAGDAFALALMETSKSYPFYRQDSPYPVIRMTDDLGRIEGEVEPMKRRLAGLAKTWKRIKIEWKPPPPLQARWRTLWNPYETCSWPPEDEVVENFSGYVRKRALGIVGLAQERVEEFKTSLRDGLHIRETMRNLHLGKVYVKEEPQIRGKVGAVVFIFDPDEGDRYPWKLTWMAEHENESTLAFYATQYTDHMVGPGIARSYYGGALFIFPPQLILDIWTDPTFDPAEDSMERLVFAGLYYCEDRYVAYVAATQPTAGMREYARQLEKRIVFIPIRTFSRSRLEKLRYFHVLNGKHVRSYASRFIR